MMDKKRMLYLIGIDSAPLWILEKLRKRKEMEGFATFAENGVLTNIQSTIPPVTSTAWPTIYTGLEPKEHGVIDFSTIGKDYERELMYYDANTTPPFWDTLASKGYSCLVMTPAVALQKSKYENVDMITGWPLQPRFSSSKVEKAAKSFEYNGEPDIGNALNTGKISLEKASALYTESTKRRAGLSKYLIEKTNYDLSFVCFTETDRIQHYSLNLKDWERYVAPLYEQISDFIIYIEQRIKKLDQDALIMLVSDHGAQPISYKFLSNSWMVQKGYATLKEKVYSKETKKENTSGSKVKRKIVDTLVESPLRREIYSRLPTSLKKVGEKLVEDSYDYETQGKYVRITESDFNMSKTKAFCSISTGTVGMVLINDSRFADQCVQDNQRNSLKKELIAELGKIKDTGGRKLMADVYDGVKYFPSKGSSIMPDIIFELKEGYTADYSGYSKDKLYVAPEINRRGEHTRMGIFGIVSSDKSIKIRAMRKKVLKLSDVNPTILKYFGLAGKSKSKSLI